MGHVVKSVVGAVGSVFGFGQKAPKPVKMPALAPVTPMPTPDDESVRRARRRTIAAQLAQSGRESTVLTSDETLG